MGATFLAMILSVVVVRFYGADMMGVVAIIQSFLGLATIITVMGTKTAILRLIPEHIVKYSPTSAFKIYRKTQYLVIVVSGFTGSIFFFGANFIAGKVFGNPDLSFYFALAAVFIVFNSLMLLNTQAVRGLRLIKVFAFMNILPSGSNLLLLVCLSFFLFAKGNPVYAMLASFAITGILGWVIMEYAFRKKMSVNDQVHPMPIREIMTISLPMFMTATMSFVIGQTGVIILGMFRTEAEVGYFAIAVKLATLTAFILAAINTMAGPKFSELYHSGNIDELFYVAKKSAKLVFWTTTPILLGFIILGKHLLGFLYGEEFMVVYPALVLMVLGQFVNSISGATGMFMNMTGHQNMQRNFVAVSALINILLCLFLIPKIGFYGAAFAGMISLIFWNMAALIFIKRKYGRITGYIPGLYF